MIFIEQTYLSKDREECFYESHQKYIDIHLIVKGTEYIEVCNTNELNVLENYNEHKDATKYRYDINGSILKLCVGDVAIFFPKDGHMTSMSENINSEITKVVAKVLI